MRWTTALLIVAATSGCAGVSTSHTHLVGRGTVVEVVHADASLSPLLTTSHTGPAHYKAPGSTTREEVGAAALVGAVMPYLGGQPDRFRYVVALGGPEGRKVSVVSREKFEIGACVSLHSAPEHAAYPGFILGESSLAAAAACPRSN